MKIDNKTRIECIHCTDPYNPIAPGTKGTITIIDGIGTVHVKWDNGRTLGLIPGEDDWKEIKNESCKTF